MANNQIRSGHARALRELNRRRRAAHMAPLKQIPKKYGRVNLLRFCKRSELPVESVVGWIIKGSFNAESGLVMDSKTLAVDLDVFKAMFGTDPRPRHRTKQITARSAAA